MNFDPENLQRHIQHYLTAEDRKVLVEELEAISKGGQAGYFLSDYNNDFKNDMLQGDGWTGFQILTFEKGERRSVRGIVLSNSCDVDPSNARDLSSHVTFAPLFRLSKIRSLLLESGLAEDRVDEKIAAIRSQKTTTIFFLPAGGPLEEDYVVRLDLAHSMPVSAHQAAQGRSKIFTLSNTGFYMLVFKLSVHFCRLHENVNRKIA
ncbi:MAG: hypothetical protein ACU0E9_07900 [Limimaricola soesokkakensis]|uniref:hypothetical protein n=1 Tax=Limimaricola soesokkakensis TaxID=1343159 RepID=UPI004058196B